MTTVHPLVSQPRLSDRLREFFYREEVPYGLAITRMVLPSVLLVLMLVRWSHARELFSTDGATAPLWINYGHATLFPEFSGTIVVALFSALILFLFTSCIGWCTRFSLIAATVLYTYFNFVDAASTMTKYSVIASHILFLLCFSSCGAIWSVDSWLKKNRRKRVVWPGASLVELPKSSAWPRRLMQLLIGFVYFGASFTKMHVDEFLSGDQMQAWLLTNFNHSNPLGEHLAQFPALLVVFGYVVIIWEVLFIFLAWNGWGRTLMIATGIAFHVMTALTLGLYFFPLICFTAYFAFINERDIQRIARFARRFKRRHSMAVQRVSAMTARLPRFHVPANIRIVSPVAFGLMAVATMMFGTELEYQLDPYGERRPEGPYTLTELDPHYVTSRMLAPTEPLRLVDKFSSLDLGTFLIGGVIGNPRRQFTQGDTILSQCNLNFAHEDMWVECNLHDSDDRTVVRVGQIVPREVLKGNYYHRLPETLEPGSYAMVIKVAGTEVMRKSFTLKARSGKPLSSAPLAN